MRCQGIVHGNVVILEDSAHLPDGVRVTVTVEPVELAAAGAVTPEELAQRRALVIRMQAFGRRLARRPVSLGDSVREGREELEARA